MAAVDGLYRIRVPRVFLQAERQAERQAEGYLTTFVRAVCVFTFIQADMSVVAVALFSSLMMNHSTTRAPSVIIICHHHLASSGHIRAAAVTRSCCLFGFLIVLSGSATSLNPVDTCGSVVVLERLESWSGLIRAPSRLKIVS